MTLGDLKNYISQPPLKLAMWLSFGQWDVSIRTIWLLRSNLKGGGHYFLSFLLLVAELWVWSLDSGYLALEPTTWQWLQPGDAQQATVYILRANNYSLVQTVTLLGTPWVGSAAPLDWGSLLGPSLDPAPHVLWAEICPLKILILKSQPIVPQNLTILGDKVFKEVFKVKWGH